MDATFEQLIQSKKLMIFTMHQDFAHSKIPKERRVTDKGLGGRVMSIEERLVDGSERMDRMEAKIDSVTVVTEEIRDIVATAKGFFKVLGWIGNAVKWMAGLLAGLGAMYAAWTHFVGQIGHK